MRKSKCFGKDFFSIFSEVASQGEEKTTQVDTEDKIRKQLKKLRDERNSHTKRIHAIDDEIVTLEESLATVVEQNRIIRKKALEEESISLEKRLNEIRDELTNMEGVATATA